MKLSKSYTPVRVVFVILSVVIMVMIFMFSCEDSDKSSDTSGTITEFVAEHVVKDFDQLPVTEKEDIFSKIDHIVRKCAHFSIYTSLGFCVSTAVGKRKFLSWGSLLTLGVCFVYACSDEYHQTFVPGRAGAMIDVAVDLVGVSLGLALVLLVCIACMRRKELK